MNFEEKLKTGYQEYLKLPKATCSGKNSNAELYSKNWCKIEGRVCIHPHPHRYYTFLEFVFYCGRDEELYERFIQPLNLK